MSPCLMLSYISSLSSEATLWELKLLLLNSTENFYLYELIATWPPSHTMDDPVPTQESKIYQPPTFSSFFISDLVIHEDSQ